MRLSCEVVFQRHKANPKQLPTTTKPRKGFAILERLRQNPPQHQIRFVVSDDKSGNKFDLSKAPAIIDRFLKQGKVTLTFQCTPAVTVFISKACPESLATFIDTIRKILRGEAVDIQKIKIKSSDFKPATITVMAQQDYKKQMMLTSEFLRTLRIEPIDLRKPDRTWIKCKNITQLLINGNAIGDRKTDLDVFSQLPHLQILELKNCQLGSLPIPIFRDMFKTLPVTLNSLDLRENQLTMFPPIFHLSQLRTLNVTFNNIRYLPSRIGSLQNLQNIDLSHNSMTTMPYIFPKIPSIQHVGIHANDELVRLEEEIGPLIASELATKVDNRDYAHEGGVDTLMTIAANAIHREENRNSLKVCPYFLPLCLRFQVEDLIYEKPGISALEMCTSCLRLRHIRYIRPQVIQSRQIADAVDVVDRFVVFNNLLCIDCHRRTPHHRALRTAPLQRDFFNFSL
ncbi:hypothetical protein L5515_014825 [Caenorhabditis briggsae]|uniref:PIF1/LRR1 pleckstrin homology domain-containing protein n=1 Tax=Caenorhabditis briggsae TaxID=6238 RepID=A0AAE9EED7_CAEBR|nr:hypothetical protein L5515_014825 [Caenorhabditis briggsae]